jgi:hypothetical protein
MAYEPSLHDRFGPRFLNRQRTARPWQRQDAGGLCAQTFTQTPVCGPCRV